MPSFVLSSVIEADVARVFAFHESPDALEQLMPPWQPARVLFRSGGLQPGARVELLVPLGPFRRRWVARHTEYVRDRLFVDVQEDGPFRRWTHRHEFNSEGPHRTRLTDRIEFSLPGGPLVDFFGAWVARLQLRRMFTYRHAVTKRICEGA